MGRPGCRPGAQPRTDERRSRSPATLDDRDQPGYRLSSAEPIRVPDARRLDRSNRAHSAMGQYIIALAKLAGVKTLNVVRREDAAEQVRQWGGDRVVQQGDNLHKDIEEALDGKKLSLVLDTVGGTPVGELAKSLKTGGSIVVYAMQGGQFPAISPKDLSYRGLSLHGFWLINWIRNAPRTEVQDIYQKLGDLVTDGSLVAAVERAYPLEQFREAFGQSLKPNRGGKVLFTFGARPLSDSNEKRRGA